MNVIDYEFFGFNTSIWVCLLESAFLLEVQTYQGFFTFLAILAYCEPPRFAKLTSSMKVSWVPNPHVSILSAFIKLIIVIITSTTRQWRKSLLSYRLVLLLPFIFPGWIIWVINFSKSWCVVPKDNRLDDFGATRDPTRDDWMRPSVYYRIISE